MPKLAAGFVFTHHDRRRLTRALRRVRDARHGRRVQAVLLVAEGHGVGGTANLLKASRRSRHQSAGSVPSASLPGRSGRGQTFGPAACGAGAFGPALGRTVGQRPSRVGLCGCQLDGAVAGGPPAAGRRGRRPQRAHATPTPARHRLGVEAAAVCLWSEGTAPRPEKGALTRRLKRMPRGAVLLAEDETTLRHLPPLRAAWLNGWVARVAA